MIEHTVQQAQEHAAGVMTGTSVLSATAAWLPIVQDWLQLLSTVIAIGAGTFAMVLHRENWKRIKGEKDNAREKDSEPSPPTGGDAEAETVERGK